MTIAKYTNLFNNVLKEEFPNYRVDIIKENNISPEEEFVFITDLITKYSGVSRKAMLSKSRLRPISHARFAAFYFLSEQGYKMPQIAKFFNLDRASVRHGLKVNYLLEDTHYFNTIKEILSDKSWEIEKTIINN